jgi:hypothetical protein
MDEEYCVEIKRKIYLCNELNCKSGARSGSDKCRLHGGGKRCNEPNCKSGASDYLEIKEKLFNTKEGENKEN